MMFVYLKKSPTRSPAEQCFLRKCQVIELSLFPASFRKNPKFIVTFLVIIISKKGSVQCVWLLSLEKSQLLVKMSCPFGIQ